jgi:hypothetical protein
MRTNLGRGRETYEALRMCLGENKCVQTWGRGPEKKSPLARRLRKDEDNIKVDLQSY